MIHFSQSRRAVRWSIRSRGSVGIAALAMILVQQTARAQGGSELHGRVVSDSGTPLAGASVTLPRLRYSVTADSLGRFVLAGTPGGMLELSISAVGYRTETVSVVLGRGRPLDRDFTLTIDDPSQVTTEPSGFLRGVVKDIDGTPLAYANVQLNGGRRYIANDTGVFTIPVNTAGRQVLLARRIGFEPAELVLEQGVDTLVILRLAARAYVLPEQQVTSRSPFVSLDLNGFYTRMADAEKGVNYGYFITPEDLEMRKPVMLTNAVEHIPYLRIRPGNAEFTKTPSPMGDIYQGVTSARNLRIEDQRGCALTVYLDGVRVQPINRNRRGIPVANNLTDEQINTLVHPTTVAGIEVYVREATIPPQYQAVASTCGVVLIWSK